MGRRPGTPPDSATSITRRPDTTRRRVPHWPPRCQAASNAFGRNLFLPARGLSARCVGSAFARGWRPQASLAPRRRGHRLRAALSSGVARTGSGRRQRPDGAAKGAAGAACRRVIRPMWPVRGAGPGPPLGADEGTIPQLRALMLLILHISDWGRDRMLRSVMAAGLVLASSAAMADNRTDCLDNKDHDLRIKGCSAVIQHNPKDVVAYHNRGDAYGLKGDFDHAIADYSKAIEINPNYAPAYNGRGRAYTSKGDYVHAVADVTRASELTPKVRPWPAVVKAAPPKAKAATQVGMPVAAKAPAAEKAPMPAKAPAAEKPQVPGKSGEKASAAVKATGVEKPSDDSWPPWAQSKLAN